MLTNPAEVRLSTDFQIFLISGSVFCQMARLHHFSPRCWPSSVAHMDCQATRSGWLTCSCALNALLMDQIQIAQGRMLVGAQFEQLGLDDDLVGGGDGVV